MTRPALASDPTARPVAVVCLACAQGDHEQALVNERCPCPCHSSPKADSEVAL